MMLQQPKPSDYVIATGEQRSVREFVCRCAEVLDMELHWSGIGLTENAKDSRGRVVVAVDPRYFRPTEVDTLLGDASRARNELGWTPRTTFDELVREMVESDLESARRDALVLQHGFTLQSSMVR